MLVEVVGCSAVFLGGNACSEIEEKVGDQGKMTESGCACL